MKILMISMFANHFFNWTNQLKDSGHEVYWIDVFDNGSKVENIGWVDQTVDWKRKKDFPGRQRLKKAFPRFYNLLKRINERSLAEIVEEKIQIFKPDVVQSFVLFSACAPILEVMKKYPDLKWMYSAWGNDLYYFQNEEDYLKDIKAVLPRVNYMFADCYRDFEIAKSYGFEGEFLGVFPGGGGISFNFENYIESNKDRKIILVKGYQKLFGECIKILEALQIIERDLENFEIVVFGADNETLNYIEKQGWNNKPNFKTHENIGRGQLLKLMGKSLIYIGNSVSDGMPNTLLEAIIMEAFPIQSNPGGATAEIIEHKKNGFLIEDPLNSKKISDLLLQALKNPKLRETAISWNSKHIKPNLEREQVKALVLKAYQKIEEDLR